MNLTLASAIVAFGLWIVFGFVTPVATGAVHALLAVGMVLLTRRVLLGKTKF